MSGGKSDLLILAARMLEYPNEELLADLSDLDVKEAFPSMKVQSGVIKSITPFFTIDLQELQELYVATFDYKDKTALYLTAQELGDSQKRGPALIQLQKFIAELGFELDGTELADYIPMLLELLAVAPGHNELPELELRLAYALDRIHKSLPQENLYYNVLNLLMTFVLKAPTQIEITQLETEREQADLEELPYPMYYL